MRAMVEARRDEDAAAVFKRKFLFFAGDGSKICQGKAKSVEISGLIL